MYMVAVEKVQLLGEQAGIYVLIAVILQLLNAVGGWSEETGAQERAKLTCFPYTAPFGAQ